MPPGSCGPGHGSLTRPGAFRVTGIFSLARAWPVPGVRPSLGPRGARVALSRPGCPGASLRDKEVSLRKTRGHRLGSGPGPGAENRPTLRHGGNLIGGSQEATQASTTTLAARATPSWRECTGTPAKDGRDDVEEDSKDRRDDFEEVSRDLRTTAQNRPSELDPSGCSNEVDQAPTPGPASPGPRPPSPGSRAPGQRAR